MEKLKLLSKRLKSRLKSLKTKRPPTPETIPENLILQRLNSDIFLYLKQFLTPTSVTCLALTCKSLITILGCNHWRSLELNFSTRDYKKELFSLLLLLESDDPDLITCRDCLILHKGDRNHYLPINKVPRRKQGCFFREFINGAYLYIHPYFYYGVFQMAMKKYRMGGDYQPFLDLLQFKGQPRLTDTFPSKTSAIARIINGCMIVRVQKDIFIPTHMELQHILKFHLPICLHKSLSGRDEDLDLPNGQLHRAQIHKSKLNSTLSKMKRCYSCGIEYEIMIQLFEGIGWVIRVVKWMDVGEGRWPGDQGWWKYLGPRYCLHGPFPPTLRQIASDDLAYHGPLIQSKKGSIARRFQGAGVAKHVIVTREEMEELRELVG
ncbi:hypothetical protein HYALB_00012852 [Hymenoscyphus albidus]|uniref:F-box domain-containing protein n=1 Tax=Hymenoscyphus albidus TaxID=595503 RepID=A0A9N9LKC0_9HELO|nr:hypothetical protein HYALB_00012852 [Hymenoscyphus albidus]